MAAHSRQGKSAWATDGVGGGRDCAGRKGLDRLHKTSPRICNKPGDRDINYGNANKYDSSNNYCNCSYYDLIKDCRGNQGIVIGVNNININGKMGVREVAGREGLED